MGNLKKLAVLCLNLLLLYLWSAQEIILLKLREKNYLQSSDLNQKAQDVVKRDDSKIKSTVNSPIRK